MGLGAFNLDLSKILLFWNSFPNEKTYSFNLKEGAGNNFEFHENGRKFPKWEENTVGEEEIIHYEQFLLSPQFSKDLY